MSADGRESAAAAGVFSLDNLTAEETAVMRECKQEAMLYRSLPMAGLLGGLASFMLRQGYLTPSARFGRTPKVLGAATVGYFIGEMSYYRKVSERLMALPDSRLGDMLRRRRDGGQQSWRPDAAGAGAGAGAGSTDDWAGSGAGVADFRRSDGGLDDLYRPGLDSPTTPLAPPPDVDRDKSAVSYDQLRQQNRAEFQARAPPPSPSPASRLPPSPYQPSPPPAYSPPPRAPRANKYGDTWES